jgi:inosine-uridine nucleoside N-ribohydrolase
MKEYRRLCFVPSFKLFAIVLFVVISCSPFFAEKNVGGVIVDHDGGVDDFIALSYLLNQKVDIRAVTIVPADCFRVPAVGITKGVLNHFLGDNSQYLPVSSSDIEGSYPFPDLWRHHSTDMAKLPQLSSIRDQDLHPSDAIDAPNLLVELLSKGEKLKLAFFGPVSNLAAALKLNPNIVDNIDRVYIMGGAVRVGGNVFDAEDHHDIYNHDGSAEWNIYNYPEAADEVFQSGVPITLVPLDATNSVPITYEFLGRLALQNSSSTSRLAYDMWQVAKPDIDKGFYHFWDTLTAAVMLDDSFVTVERLPLRVIIEPPSQGRTMLVDSVSTDAAPSKCSGSETCSASDGRDWAWVDVVTSVDKNKLEELMLKGLL